jgi:hypothetical protein
MPAAYMLKIRYSGVGEVEVVSYLKSQAGDCYLSFDLGSILVLQEIQCTTVEKRVDRVHYFSTRDMRWM